MNVGAQHRFIMAGGLGVQPPEVVRFLQSQGIKIPKINNTNLYSTSPLDYCNFQQDTTAHPGPH